MDFCNRLEFCVDIRGGKQMCLCCGYACIYSDPRLFVLVFVVGSRIWSAAVRLLQGVSRKRTSNSDL